MIGLEGSPHSDASAAWLTSELLDMFKEEGFVEGSVPAKRTRTRTRKLPKISKSERQGSERQTAVECQRDNEEDVLVDALAEFMRPASQSTLRTRQTGASGSGSHAVRVNHNGGLTAKQLAALECISEHIDDTAATAAATDNDTQSKRRSISQIAEDRPGRTPRYPGGRTAPASVPVPPIDVPVIGGSFPTVQNKRVDREVYLQQSVKKMPRIKEFVPFVNMTKAGLRRRKKENQEDQEKQLHPVHPIVISRRFNRARDDLQRTLKIPPSNDASSLRRFRSRNHSVPARELGVVQAAA